MSLFAPTTMPPLGAGHRSPRDRYDVPATRLVRGFSESWPRVCQATVTVACHHFAQSAPPLGSTRSTPFSKYRWLWFGPTRVLCMTGGEGFRSWGLVTSVHPPPPVGALGKRLLLSADRIFYGWVKMNYRMKCVRYNINSLLLRKIIILNTKK